MSGVYYPRAPKEPSGCLQSWLIIKAIFSILAVPLLLLGGALLATLATLFLFFTSPPLALIPLSIGAAGIYARALLWDSEAIVIG